MDKRKIERIEKEVQQIVAESQVLVVSVNEDGSYRKFTAGTPITEHDLKVFKEDYPDGLIVKVNWESDTQDIAVEEV